MKYKALAIGVLALLYSSVGALEFERHGGTFAMYGEIADNDFEKFVHELMQWDAPPTIFYIDSPGGSLDAAMAIGGLIRSYQIPVWSGETCDSACVFIYAAGVERKANGPIGLHRPYFNKEYFSNLSSTEAQKKYQQLKEDAIGYLQKIEMSRSIIDRLFQTRSTEIDIISEGEAVKVFGEKAPFFEEWLVAKCGSYSADEQKVLDSLSSLEMARITLAALEDDSIPKSEEFGFNIEKLATEAQLAL